MTKKKKHRGKHFSDRKLGLDPTGFTPWSNTHQFLYQPLCSPTLGQCREKCLITCRENELTGFYMMATLAFNGLIAVYCFELMVTKSLTIRFSDTPQPNTHSNSGCRDLTYYFRLLNLRLISIEYNITVSHTNAKTNNCKEPTCSEGNLRNCHITFFHLLIDV